MKAREVLVSAALLLLFMAVHLSHASVDLHPAQHPGNYFDETRLTLTVEEAPSLSAAFNSLEWGKPTVAWAYFLNKHLGLETVGRRVFGVFLAVIHFGYFAFLLFIYPLLRPTGTVLCLAWYGVGVVASMYVPLGLTSLSLLLLYSVVLLHLVLAFSGRRLTWKAVGLLGTLLSALCLHAVYSVVSILSAVTALAIQHVIRRIGEHRSNRLSAVRGTNRYVVLMLPVALTAIFWALFSPHREFVNPQRGFDLYFMLSGEPRNLFGLLVFSTDRTLDLVISALELHPTILHGLPAATGIHQLVVFLTAAFLVVGIVRSFFDSRSLRFVVALCFVLTLGGHLLLSILTLVPYGNMRYLLPMACFFPVLAVLGLNDVLGAVWASIGRLSGCKHELSSSTYNTLTVFAWLLILTLPIAYVWKAVPSNLQRAHAIQEGFEHFWMESSDEPTSLVLDDWTSMTVHGLRPLMMEEVDYTFQIDRRSLRRGQKSGELDALEPWQEFLADKEQVYVITSLPFTSKYYAELFRASSRHFVVERLVEQPNFHFAFLQRRNETFELLEDSGELTDDEWVRQGTRVTPEQGRFEIDFITGGGLIQQVPVTVQPGDKLVARADLWGNAPTKIQFILKRGDPGPYEGATALFAITHDPTEAVVSYVFQKSWESVIVGWIAPEEASLYIRDPSLQLVPSGVRETPK